MELTNLWHAQIIAPVNNNYAPKASIANTFGNKLKLSKYS